MRTFIRLATENVEATVANVKSDAETFNAEPLHDRLIYFFHLKNHAKALSDAVKALNSQVERFNKGLVPEAIEESGMDLVRVPHVARSFYPLVKTSASMVDKAKVFEWLRERGAEDLITETVNSSTLAAYCKSLLEDEGIEPPEDLIRVSTYRITGMSKYTPKADAGPASR